MSLNQYADFIVRLPKADIPMAGVDAALLADSHGQVVFLTLPAEASVPPHSHGEQWGIVVEGEVDLTIDGVQRTYRRRDAYYIGDAVVHSAVVRKGCLAIDAFADPQRYRAKV